MKDDDWNGEAADAEMCADGILEIQRAPNAECCTANTKDGKGSPPTNADVLPSKPPEQSNERPTAQREKNDD